MSMKVVCVVDKEGTALDRLAKGVAKYHDNLDYQVIDVHPKRPSFEQVARFEDAAKDADVIDWQYFRSAETLRSLFPWVRDKKQILTHNNPYSIEEQNWNDYSLNVGNNRSIHARLLEITQAPTEYVPLTVDTDFWTFNDDWQPNKSVIMVANRIEGKKGILEVAIACNELNLRFILVGAVSDPNYMHAIRAAGPLEFHEQVSDEELRELYWRSTIHVCNSQDNFESGTLPILEAMLCGVPVLTRNVGHVPDLNNGENMVLNDASNEDVQAIVDKLHEMMADKKLLTALRTAGWNTAKSRSHERRAYMYQRLYRDVAHEGATSVSVVVPIYDKPDVIRECLSAIDNQTHQNIEIVVVDDGDNAPHIERFRQMTAKPIRYLNTAAGDYGLARARNEGTIAATGEVIVYCDQRMIMAPDCVEQFLNRLKPKHWLWGNKGGKKDFVENLSCVHRDDVIVAGLFNERINRYGGQSQEIRTRVRKQGMITEYIESAKATPRGSSHNRSRKRQDIIAMKNRLFIMGLE